MDTDIRELLQCAVEAARLGGAILLEGFGTAFRVSNKEGIQNLVTEYDTRCEDAVISFIRTKFPEHSFLAEESGGQEEAPSSAVRWIIDPLDGTVNFAHNVPIFCVSIAAEYRGDILAGAIYQPVTNELFTAEKGGGAWLNGNKISVSEISGLDKSLLVTGFPYNVNENPGKCIDQFGDMLRHGVPVRRLGSAALDLAYLAAGRFEAFWEIRLQPWDVAAGMLMVREAGGILTHYDGTPYTYGTGTMLASNGKIHEEVRTILLKNSCG